MTLRWTMEAVWAAVAVTASIGGGLFTTVYRSGASSVEVSQLSEHQAVQDRKIDEHDSRLRLQESNAAAEKQALGDIKDQLDRIEKKL